MTTEQQMGPAKRWRCWMVGRRHTYEPHIWENTYLLARCSRCRATGPHTLLATPDSQNVR